MDFKIVKTKRDLDIAREIVYRAYLRKGITDPVEEERMTHSNYNESNSVTILGYKDGIPTLTASFVIDTPEYGIPLEDYYPEDIEKMRKTNGGIIEGGLFGDIRTLSNYRDILSIVSIVFNGALQNNCRYLVIGVNPNSERFYEHNFGLYAPHKEVYEYDKLNDAPLLLLIKDLEVSPWDDTKRGVMTMNRLYNDFDGRIELNRNNEVITKKELSYV